MAFSPPGRVEDLLPCEAEITDAMGAEVPARALQVTFDTKRPRFILKETLAAGASFSADFGKVLALLVDGEPCALLIRISNNQWVSVIWGHDKAPQLLKSAASISAAMPKYKVRALSVATREELTAEAILARAHRAPVIVSVSGSARTGSVNKKLQVVANKAMEEAGATVHTIDLDALKLPVFNQDLEKPVEAFPESARKLKEDLKNADAFMFTCPDYNGFITPLLLNSITWATRGDGGMYDAFKGKVAVTLSASPGSTGGGRGACAMRDLLVNCGTTVLPATVSIGGAFKAFNEDGSLADAKQEAHLKAAIGELFVYARSNANREATCQLVQEVEHLGQPHAYGAISVPEGADK